MRDTFVVGEALVDALVLDPKFAAVLAPCIRAYRDQERSTGPAPCGGCAADETRKRRQAARASLCRCLLTLDSKAKAKLKEILDCRIVQVRYVDTDMTQVRRSF